MRKIYLKILIVFGLLSGFCSNLFIPTQGYSSDDIIDTDFDIPLVEGDWFGMIQKEYELYDNGTENWDEEDSRMAIGVETAEKIGNRYEFMANIYTATNDLSNFPAQDGSISVFDWEFVDQIHLFLNKTRIGMVNPFIVPRDITADEIYKDELDVRDYLYREPLIVELNATDIMGSSMNETLFYATEQVIEATETSVLLTFIERLNASSLYSDDIYTFYCNTTYFMDFNPKTSLMQELFISMWVHTIVYENSSLTEVYMDRYSGGGGSQTIIYDSNPHRGEWFYENWQWFVPTILIATVGIFVLVWWQLSVKKCEQSIANTFCKDPVEWRKKKYGVSKELPKDIKP